MYDVEYQLSLYVDFLLPNNIKWPVQAKQKLDFRGEERRGSLHLYMCKNY